MSPKRLHVLGQARHLLYNLGLGTPQIHHQASFWHQRSNIGQLVQDGTHRRRQHDHISLPGTFSDIGRPPVDES
jgi:hypothetical protein